MEKRFETLYQMFNSLCEHLLHLIMFGLQKGSEVSERFGFEATLLQHADCGLAFVTPE